MFQLELIGLLNEYKQTTEEYSKNKIKSSICKLIKENGGEYNNFIQNQDLDSQTTEFLNRCEKEVDIESELSDAHDNNKSSDIQSNSDLEKIKMAFLTWEKEYKLNNNIPSKECENIINQMIDFYAPNRFEVLQKVLSINDTETFEKFKYMLMNYLRKFFSEKIEKYFLSDEFNTLGFFAKRSMKRKILEVLDELGEYKFNIKKIDEVLGK